MPRSLRVVFAIVAFAIFFSGSLLLGLVVFPLLFLLALGNWEKHKDRCTRICAFGYGTFLYGLKFWGLIDYDKLPPLPAELEGKTFVVVANHPSLIDVCFLLNRYPQTTTMVKAQWSRFVFFGPVLKSLHYLPDSLPDDDPFTGTLERMTEHVKEGHSLIAFPEGTRSETNRLHRFKRGAFEVAVRAGVPILPVVITVDPPVLQRGAALSLEGRGRYEFEFLPVIDTQGRKARELRTEVEELIGSRFKAFIQSVGREPPALEPLAFEAERKQTDAAEHCAIASDAETASTLSTLD